MSEYKPLSNANTARSDNDNPQLLLESGPMLLRDFNPKGVLRFAGRKCVTCNAEIMDHWLRPNDDPDLRAEYWCEREGDVYSLGITDCTFDVSTIEHEKLQENDNIKRI